ncbi:unnamed protein product [Acanthoscelides obtectus]|uniref:Uncharacterized protein n=1 Tax=Acanthoscelides obtectus TaxID=200917 RepID=A0A9P0JWB3_ACAOB|nr:unnamed protein product [Acanthoscelides obtectus]CAK1648980.1 hypothetical protein AOBTE_LOCUS15981 [Acanthoscelides obtectus]
MLRLLRADKFSALCCKDGAGLGWGVSLTILCKFVCNVTRFPYKLYYSFSIGFVFG